MKLDKKGSKKNNKAVGLASILLSLVMVGSGLSLTGCANKEKKDTKDNSSSLSYQTENDMISTLKNELKKIAPEFSDEKLTDTALILTLNLIAKENENGKVRSDIMDYFKNKVDSDSMMDNFN